MDPYDIEHERKFLFKDKDVLAASEGTSIVQGYLSAAHGFSVRIRWYPTLEIYQVAVKGGRVGSSRLETEEPISPKLGEALLHACHHRIIEKTRYPVAGPDGHGWDVDVFHGANEGLILAELELTSPNEPFVLPAWCGLEVTEDGRYCNEYLAAHPYNSW